jgi:hypothetical protein
MADFDTSSYARPASPNPLDQITKIGQAASSLGDIEAGKAVQGAILPDGSIDRNALAQSLKGTVAGSMKAIPTLNAYEQLRNAGHVADEAGLDNFQKRMAVVNHLFGQLASKPNPTIQDVNAIAARVLDPAVNGPKYGITFPVVMNALKNFRGPDGRPLPPAEIKQRALDIQTMTASTAEQLAAHSPQQAVVDDGNTITFVPKGTTVNPTNPQITKRIPTGTPVRDAEGKPVLVPPQEPAPIGQVDRNANPVVGNSNNFGGFVTGATPPTPVATPPAPTFAQRFAPSMTGAPATGLRPGQEAATVSTAETSAKLGNDLITAANEVPQTKAILGNLEREVEGFTPGPGADYRRVAKAFANTILPESWQKEGSVLDPKSIADQEGFNKLAYNLAQNQFQALGGTGTDAKLNSTMHTSPNELMSKYGIKGVINILKGNTDALSVKAKEWNAWKKKYGPDTYNDFSDQFNDNFDPRVFQYKYVPKSDRQSWYKAMSPDERRSFEAAASYAIDKGWIREKDFK